MKIGFIYPGQGLQAKGMGLDIINEYKSSREILDTIEDVCKINLIKVLKEGDESKLNDPYISGLLVYTISQIIQEILINNKIRPNCVSGYSIGQYSALNCANVIKNKDCAKIVSERGILLKKYGEKSNSSMMGVIGLNQSQIIESIKKFESCEIANYSTKTNFTLSYCKSEYEKIKTEIYKKEPINIIDIPVKGGWHSSFMKNAEKELKEIITKFKFSEPSVNYIDNVDGETLLKVDIIKKKLISHIYKPVMWLKCMENMINIEKIDFFVEVGYGDMLSKFSKLINRRIPIYNTTNIQKIDSLINEIKK